MQTRHLLTSAALALAFCASGAFAADEGCRTVANGVQKCDVITGHERSREDVVAELLGRSPSTYTIAGCRTVANGVQHCDVPSPYTSRHETAVAAAH